MTSPLPYTWTSTTSFFAYFDDNVLGFDVINLDNPAQSINGSILNFYDYSDGSPITVSFSTSFSDDYDTILSILNFNLIPGEFFITPLTPNPDPTAPPTPGEAYNVFFEFSSTIRGAADSNNSSGPYHNQTSTPTLYINSGLLVLNSGTFSDSIVKPRV